MPYFKYRGKRKYEYELANGQFTPEDLDPELRQVFDVLRELGVRTVYCRYNGGGDEGFAQLSGVKLEDRIVEFDDLKQQLAEGSLGSKTSDKYLCRYYSYSSFGFEEPSREQRVEFFLDLLAGSLATRLLGQGYGTGEYSMKGSFRVNLETREIIDEQRQ